MYVLSRSDNGLKQSFQVFQATNKDNTPYVRKWITARNFKFDTWPYVPHITEIRVYSNRLFEILKEHVFYHYQTKKKRMVKMEEEEDVEHTWSDVEEVYVITHDIPAFVAAYIDWKSKAIYQDSVSRTEFKMFQDVRTRKRFRIINLQANHTVLYDQTVFDWNT